MSDVALRRVARTESGAGFPHDQQGVGTGDLPFFKVGDFALSGNEKYLRVCNNWVDRTTARSLGARPVPAGAILLPKVGAALLGNARRICTQPSVFDNNVMAVIPIDVDSRFMHYWLSIIDLGEMANPGPVPSINEGPVRELRMPEIGLTRGEEIATYLDAETVRIDALIEKKRRMVEVLDERAKPRPTPKWRIFPPLRLPAGSKIGTVTQPRKIALGRQRSPANDIGPDMVRYLRAANVKDGVLDFSDVKEMNFSPSEQSRFSLRRGDVLVTEGSGSLASVGASSAWNQELPGVVCFQNTLVRLRPQAGVSGRFVEWWCRFAYHSGLFAGIAGGANIYHLGAERIRALPCTIPKLEQQIRMAGELDTAFAHRDKLRSSMERQIDLLMEHRQALITAAVTGALDIPGVAA